MVTTAPKLLTSQRERFLQLSVFAVWIVLAARLLHVQYFSREVFASQAHRQQVSNETIAARPGDILDRKGRLLATTVSVPSLYLNPSQIEDPQTLAQRLALVLPLDEKSLIEKLRNNSDKKFIWCRRHLSLKQKEALETLELPAETYGFRDEFKRFYPQDSLAAHVIGLRDIDGNGRGGVEESFNQILTGTNGIRKFVRDARGRVLEVLEEVTQPPENGKTVVLTIDTILQLHTEKSLDDLVTKHRPVGATAIVLDPRNGEVLALASRPTFNPSDPAAAPLGSWKNLAVSAVYEPGSTFKPLVVGWGLSRGILKTDDHFNCEWGTYRMGRRLLHDHHAYGDLSLADVLVKSSNIGMAKIGERLGNEQLYSLSRTFGFGQKTGIELSGEVDGLVRPLRDWNSYSTGSIPMGHEIAVTPVQMISAHAILANGGRKISPHLLLKTSHRARQTQQVVVSQTINADDANWVIQSPMRQVVERGTGQKAQLESFTVFGKTGTAQKVNPQGGYFTNKNVCSFLCGAPAENPQLLVLICVDEPRGSSQFGGTVAAPFAAKILENCLKSINN